MYFGSILHVTKYFLGNKSQQLSKTAMEWKLHWNNAEIVLFWRTNAFTIGVSTTYYRFLVIMDEKMDEIKIDEADLHKGL